MTLLALPNEPEADGGDPRLRCFACGEVHERARIVKTHDGREMGNYSEEWRRYHEAKWVLKKYRSKNTRRKYLLVIEANRGVQAMLELRAEMMLQYNWKKGQA